MSAKVDSAAVQDGYQIYQHCFIFTETGKWCVVQQGMNSGARPGRPAGRPYGSASRVLRDGWARPVEENRYARRYHWLGQSVKDFVCEPHNAVCCDRRGEVLNMVAEESGPARVSSAEIARQEPAKVLAELKTVAALDLPRRHFVSLSDIESTRMQKIFLKTFEKQPGNFEELLGMFLRHRPGKPASLKAGCPACPWRKNTVAGRWPQDHPSAGVARRTDLWHKAEPARSGPFELCARREGWPSVPGGQGDI
jgi:hypothetical protein